jgi:hypothetical protein
MIFFIWILQTPRVQQSDDAKARKFCRAPAGPIFLIDFALTTGRKYHHESFSVCGGTYRYRADPRGEYLCLRSTCALLDKVGG